VFLDNQGDGLEGGGTGTRLRTQTGSPIGGGAEVRKSKRTILIYALNREKNMCR